MLRTSLLEEKQKLCTDVPVLSDETFSLENSLKGYQLNDSCLTEGDLVDFGNGLEVKGSNEVFSYGWPELQNFEDVDDMLRNCDSTFGLDLDNSDDFSWSFPSAPGIVGSSTDVLAPSFDFPSYNSDMGLNDSPKELILSSCKRDPQQSFSPENNQQPEISYPSDQVLPGSGLVNKSEVDVFPTKSLSETSGASNQAQSCVSSRDISFENPVCSENRKKGKSHHYHHHRSSRYTKKSNLLVQRADSDTLCAKTPIRRRENDAKGRNEVVCGSDVGFSGEMGSSNKQGSSCASSVSNETATDACSLNQLQHLMVQLCPRTKLCIRDSLYRLARSAAQRHSCVNPSSAEGDDKDAVGALLPNRTNKCARLIDIETDTNPIDRSIAHLLFHRPSDPLTASAPNPLRA